MCIKFIIKTSLNIKSIFLSIIITSLSGCLALDTPWPECELITKTYDRSEFGDWIDADNDGENTRAEVLIEESGVAVVKSTNSFGVSVVSGSWYDLYTGLSYTNADDLDVDHLVPLKEAWVSGACYWDADKKVRFANELGDNKHLLAVGSSINRSKGDRDPAHWLPSNQGFVSQYLDDWMSVKIKWNLTADLAEYDFFSSNVNRHNTTLPSGFKRTTCSCGD